MRRISISPPVAALILAVVLFLLSGLLPNGFGSDLDVARAQATNILRLAVFLGVIAAGQTLVIISGSEGIDLSAGSVVTLTAILTYIFVNGVDAKVLPALFFTLVVGALIGFINGVGITFLKISPFVMTLGMAGVVTGAIIVITHGSVTGKVAPIMTRLIARPLSPSFQIPNAIIIWILFGILIWLLLERTTFGRNLFAIGVNRVTARLSGVNVTGMNLLTYSLAGALAGFGGFLLVGNTGVVHLQLGQPFLFPSIAAVAVGGTLLSGGKGSYWGTMAGAIVLTLITSLLTTMQMPESVRRMVLGGTLLILISIYGRQRAEDSKLYRDINVALQARKGDSMSKTVKVGMVGSGFVGDLHYAAFKGWVRDAEVVAVSSPHNAKTFAEERGIPTHYDDYREMLKDKEIDVVDIGIPNDLHHRVVIDAARAGKHVIIEKPLCVTLEEADEMIEECKKAGVLLMYAEELLFAPKYVRAKTLVDEGAIGEPFLAKQSEEHPGPHMGWFWDVNRSGGGVMLDMGCHSIEYTRWVLGKPKVKSVTAFMGTYLHHDKTKGEDHSYAIIEYEGDKVAMIENSWAKGGGVDDRCEIYGKKGHTRADLLRGSSLLTYSEEGYGYAVEKAGQTKGYTFTMFEEIWNYGFPQEMQHFVNCVLGKETPMETGEDGREVLKIMYAAYQSAGEGRRIEFPYDPPTVSKPIDLWKKT